MTDDSKTMAETLRTLMPDSVWLCVGDDIEDALREAREAGFRDGVEQAAKRIEELRAEKGTAVHTSGFIRGIRALAFAPPEPLIVGRKVISEPGAAIELTELELSEEARASLCVNKPEPSKAECADSVWQKLDALAARLLSIDGKIEDSKSQRIAELQAEAEAYRKAVADKLHWDMQALLKGSPQHAAEQRIAELQQQSAAMRLALEEIRSFRGVDVINSPDHAFRMWNIANSALAHDAGRKFAERVEKLERVADGVREERKWATGSRQWDEARNKLYQYIADLAGTVKP
jgi:hypothetical protein